MKYKPQSKEETAFLKTYDTSGYDHPSVIVDNVIFSTNINLLTVILVKRGEFPYKNRWALPGRFIAPDEDADAAAARELYEEINLKSMSLMQLKAYSDPDRDPRARVIFIAYIAMVPFDKVCENIKDKDDAENTSVFSIYRTSDGIRLHNILTDDPSLSSDNDLPIKDLAFDHEKILLDAIERLQGRLDYTDDFLSFIQNPHGFTMEEARAAYSAVQGYPAEISDFSRAFKKRFIQTHKAEETREKIRCGQGRPLIVYKLL